MKLITAFQLASETHDSLETMFRTVSRELTRTAPDTIERANALASLENISRARTHRLA